MEKTTKEKGWGFLYLKIIFMLKRQQKNRIV